MRPFILIVAFLIHGVEIMYPSSSIATKMILRSESELYAEKAAESLVGYVKSCYSLWMVRKN